MKTPLVILAAALIVGAVAPAQADNAQLCESQARNMERELSWRRDQMSLEDRMQAHQRLGAASNLCRQDATRASQDMQSLQRDLIQQSRLPPSPGQPRSPGSSGMN